ncbi:hypothetical protein JHK84_055449 [Glycine max]|nr:hypothetical protein JHK85_056422 [Glycine max]KAG5074218.1 hypothetical protein JHK84_055449 [Glycine max]
MAQEEETSIDQIPEPSLVPIPDDSMPFAPAFELEQPIPQDSPAAQVLDLNEHAQEQSQEESPSPIEVRAHHSAYFGKRALEAAREATFAERPRFCN